MTKQHSEETSRTLYQKIVPAIMPVDFADMKEKAGLVKGVVQKVQIDVMDGRFVESVSWPFKKHGNIAGASGMNSVNLDQEFRHIQSQDAGLPFWEDLDYEIDLMVSNLPKAVEEWSATGASRVILHLREENMLDVKVAMDVAVERGLDISVAVLPKPLSQALHDFIFENESMRISGIQCMGIDHVGFQHEHFNVYTIDLLKSLRAEIDVRKLPIKLSVDGGVSFDNAGVLFDAGADYLVSGSGVYDAKSPRQALDYFADITGE